jgi:hypothetical protein
MGMAEKRKLPPRGKCCLAGCAVLLGLVVILVATGTILLDSVKEPKPIAPKEAFALAGNSVFVALRLEEDDALARSWAERALKETKLGRRVEGQRAFAEYDRVRQLTGLSLFPVQCVLSGSVGETKEDDRFGCTLSATRGGGAVTTWLFNRFIARSAQGEGAAVEEHDGVRIVPSDDGSRFLALCNNSFIVASDTGIMGQLLDRHAEHTRELTFDGNQATQVMLDADDAVKAAYSRLDRASSLVFVATNGDSGLNRLLARAVAAANPQPPEATVEVFELALTGLTCVAGSARPLDDARVLFRLQAYYPADADVVERNAAVKALLSLLKGRGVAMQVPVQGEASLLISGTTVLAQDTAASAPPAKSGAAD